MDLPRRPEFETVYREIADTVDKETMFLSGGFSGSLGFRTLVEYGPGVLPVLLEQIAEPEESHAFWWRAEAVWTIGHLMHRPVPFAPEERGQLDKVRTAILWWGLEHEYLKLD